MPQTDYRVPNWLILLGFENCINLTILALLLISVDYFYRVLPHILDCCNAPVFFLL